ncbi:hypothetical protein [Lysobacter gummosus]
MRLRIERAENASLPTLIGASPSLFHFSASRSICLGRGGRLRPAAAGDHV